MPVKVTLEKNSKKIMRRITRRADRTLTKLGVYLTKDFTAKLQGPRTGNFYFVIELNDVYQASAPKEYPAKKLGKLIKSLSHKVKRERDGVSMYFGTDIEYAQALEVGLGSPRPFLRRGLLENLFQIQARLRSL